jgi:hypothetical protein
MKRILMLSASALALALPFSSFAATLPQPKTDHGVTYLSGGIGEDESSAMKAEAKNYPLSVVLSAGKDGAYVAEVPIVIKDAAGEQVLDVKGGPIVLVKLLPGRYTISATRKGEVVHRTVTVKAKGDTRASLHWPKA